MSRSAFFATAIIVGLAPRAASAQEANYAKLGRWSITTLASDKGFVACAADVDNGKVQLRIRMDGRNVLVGVPYYGNKRKVQGYYGFGDAAEMAEFSKVDDGWAMLSFVPDQLQALRSNPTFSVNLDRGLQNFSLKGAGPAIDKAVECARNRGQAQTVASPPSVAQARSAGGKNCPAPGRYRSQNSNQPVNVVFFNGGNVPLEIYWIDFNGALKKYHTLRPNSHVNQKTFATHPWIAVDPQGNCRGSVAMPNPRGGAEENNFQFW
jgi:VHL beta domain